MRFRIFLSLLIFVQCGCVSQKLSSRLPQQVEAKQEAESAEQVFQSIVRQIDDKDRAKATESFLIRQRDFHFIAEEMLNSFDAELEKLYNLKQQDFQLADKDFEKFNQLNFQLRVAREFSEKNLNQLIEVYSKVLPQANDPAAEFYKPSGELITTINKWLKNSKKENPAAVLNLAQHLDDVNIGFKKELISSGRPAVGIPSFANMYKTNSSSSIVKNKMSGLNVLDQQAQKESKETAAVSDINKEWLQYQAERSINGEAEIKLWTEIDRKPQALDTLYPDAGPSGYVTGNRFPMNTWAITLDDGPHPVHTAGMFKVLKNAGMTGTFFWQTQNLKLYPQYSEQARQLGFNRANHSYTHANLPKLSQEELNHEINDAFDDFERIVGMPPTLFRCPYGACGDSGASIRQMIAARNALHISWNVDSLDWQDKNPESIFQRTRKQMELRNHGIVLFHDVHAQSVIALGLLTDYIKQKGYVVKALPTIIGEVREKPYASP